MELGATAAAVATTLNFFTLHIGEEVAGHASERMGREWATPVEPGARFWLYHQALSRDRTADPLLTMEVLYH